MPFACPTPLPPVFLRVRSFTFADEAEGKTVPEFERLPSSREPSLEIVPEGVTPSGDGNVEM